MRAGVAATSLAGIAGRVTISIGVATRPDVDDVAMTWEALLHEADAQLYRVKSAGRNRVISQQSSVA